MRLSTILPLVSAAMLASSAVARPVSYITFRDDADLAERALGDLDIFELFGRGYLGEQLSVRAEHPPGHPGPFPERHHFGPGQPGMDALADARRKWHANAQNIKKEKKGAEKEEKGKDKLWKLDQAHAKALHEQAAHYASQGGSPPAQGRSHQLQGTQHKVPGSRPPAQSKTWKAPKK